MKKFEELAISQEILDAVSKKGYEYLSEIQELVIPELLKERSHVIGQAQTGTGKTAAFSIPILETIKVKHPKVVKAIILAPTRELANQVSDEINSLKGTKDIKVLAVYGGASIETQLRNLKKGVDIVVGTPGRVMDMMRKKALVLNELEYFVLDEADEMLNMGFIEDIESILEATNEDKKMLFFSATLPKDILKVAKKFMPGYKTLKVDKKTATTSLTDQIYYEVSNDDKFEALCRVLDYRSDFYGIVFCKTKADVDDVTNKLKSRNYDAESIHGDISQALREKALRLFKDKVLKILVATDVAARGIDVNDLTHVINYSIPHEIESYIHRIGRTGRAGKKGIAITFVTSRELKKLLQITKFTKSEIKKMDIPNPEMIVKSKIESLEASIEEIVKEQDYKSYMELAQQILKQKTPEVVLAALLRHVYDDDFDVTSYKDIKAGRREDRDLMKTRLFISLGELDGYDVKKLLNMLHTKTKVPSRKIKDVKVLPKFSFITVPLEEAEVIMKKLNKGGMKPLVEVSTNSLENNTKRRKSKDNDDKQSKTRSRRSSKKDSGSKRDSSKRGNRK